MLLLFITQVVAVIQLTKFYSGDLTCSNTEYMWLVTQPSTCTPTACTNTNNQYGSIVSCPSTVTYPLGWSVFSAWQGSTACVGNPDSIIAMPSNGCSGLWVGATVSLQCGVPPPGSLGTIADCGVSTPSCGSCPYKQANIGSTCTTGNPTTSFAIASYTWSCPASTTTSTIRTTTTALSSTSSSTAAVTTRPSFASRTEFHTFAILFALYFIF